MTPASNDDFDRLWRRTAVLVRALVPRAADAESALNEIAARVQASRACDEFTLIKLARDVAADHRCKSAHNSFSDDLARQLADSAPKSLDVAGQRSHHLASIMNQLPASERDLLRRRYALALTTEQIAFADGRPATAVSRDLTILHGTLVNALQESLPDGNPPAPGGASDLGRLSNQLLDGTITDDGRLVLETLLLGDTAAQAHYHRHVALVAELEWLFRGAPKPIEQTQTTAPRKLTAREIIVTGAFLTTCVLAVAFVVLLLTGQLRKWF